MEEPTNYEDFATTNTFGSDHINPEHKYFGDFYQCNKEFEVEKFSRNTPTCKSCSFKYVDKAMTNLLHIRSHHNYNRGCEIRAVKQ